jgi:hypothetical protein
MRPPLSFRILKHSDNNSSLSSTPPVFRSEIDTNDDINANDEAEKIHPILMNTNKRLFNQQVTTQPSIIFNDRNQIASQFTPRSQSQNQVQKILTGYNFALEDTNDKCYRDITACLLERGWRKVSHRKRSKVEGKKR